MPPRVPPRVPPTDRVSTLRQLGASWWWKELLPRGRSRAPLIPRITVGRGMLGLFPPAAGGGPLHVHRETLVTDPSISWCEGVTLVRHLTKLWEACDGKAKQRSRGVLNAVEFVEKIKLAAQTQKYRSHLAWMSAENMADLVLSQGGMKIANSVSYLHSLAVGVQRCSNLVRAQVLPAATEDFDMVNAMTNLVVQAVRELYLPSLLGTWSDYAERTTAPRVPRC